jgi:thiol:disulfide interchange protein DsbD
MKNLLLLFIFFFSQLSAQENPVSWEFETKKVSDCEYDLVFKATIKEPWHIYSIHKNTSKEAEDIWPTTILFNKSSSYSLVGKLKESKPTTEFDKVWETVVSFHPHKASFTQRVKLNTPDKVKIKGNYEVQACTDAMCTRPPVDKFEFELQGSAACATTSAVVAIADTLVKDTLAQAAILVNDTASKQDGINEVKYNSDEEAATSMSWWTIFLAGFIGGFAALLTPCVFPMIPMNVSFFTKQSKTKQQGIKNALIYAVFLIVLYVGLGLGVTLIFGAGALHSLSTNVWFNLAFFVLLLVFAISFLGAFEIVLPSSFVNKIDAKSEKGGYIGIFFMAFTLALVSFSCTGPIIGTLLVQAAAGGGISGPFWGMFGFSLALALPFGLFAAFPGWLNSLPKSGGWLNSVKVVLGFLELALALKFASNADLVVQAGILTRETFISLWIVIFALQTAYLLGAFKTSHDSDLKHVSVTRLFFAIVSLFVTVYLIPGLWGAPLKMFSGILPPLEYSESPHGFGGNSVSGNNNANLNSDADFGKFIEVNKNGIAHFKNDYENALAYAKKIGKPLFVDFTGHACANCRKTEDYVWPDAEVTKRLNNDFVLVSLYVDDKRPLDPKDYLTVEWYGKQREITDIGDKFKYMEEKLYGQSTQPLYVLLDHNEKPLVSVRGYNPSIEEYIKWMDEGLSAFKTKKQ